MSEKITIEIQKEDLALAVSESGATYVVARYSPPGNFIGERPY